MIVKFCKRKAIKMPSASIKKEIPCSKENLIKMVLDIEKYPKFVPWCLNGKIHSKNDNGDKVTDDNSDAVNRLSSQRDDQIRQAVNLLKSMVIALGAS